MVVETRTVVARAAVRIATGVATIVLLLLLFEAAAPGRTGAVAVGVAMGTAIVVSALVEARIWRTPLSVGFLIVRAAGAGLVGALILYYLRGR